MLTWRATVGFSLDASVRIHGADAAGRERLIRYCARPPFALERLRIQPHAPPAHLSRHRPDQARRNSGPVRRVFYRPPRPRTDGRELLVLSPLEFLAALARLIPPPRVHRHRYHGVARIYEVFPLRCPRCGAAMRILAFLTDPAPIGAILRHLDLPTSPPHVAPARAPPQHDLVFDSEHALGLDQTPNFDPADPEPVPDFQFDQSAGA